MTSNTRRQARCRHSWRHRNAAASSSTAHLADDAALARRAEQRRHIDLLQTHGFIVVKLPPEVVAASQEVNRLFSGFFSMANAIKNEYRTRQDGETVLSHPGYLTPSPGWAELFEVRKSKRDSSYRFPPRTEPACIRLFELMRAQALHWLAALSLYLTEDEHFLRRVCFSSDSILSLSPTRRISDASIRVSREDRHSPPPTRRRVHCG